MKKIICAIILIALPFLGVSQVILGYPGGGTPVDTQNGNGTTNATCGTVDELNLTVNIPSSIGVLDPSANVLRRVDIDITHSYAGDVVVSLIAPDGVTEVILTDSNGGSGMNYTGTQFIYGAATSIADGSATAPFTGQFRPEEPLSTFNGLNAGGTWTLRFCDDANGDTGTFNSWSLTFGPPDCDEPSGLTATNITTTSADLGWTENNSTTTSWDIEFGVTGFTANGSVDISTTNNPYTLSALSQDTSYDFYVRTRCQPAWVSNWAGPFTFTTLVQTTPMEGGFGINTTSPSSALDVGGGIRALNRDENGVLYECNASVEGVIGYDTTDKKVKVCTNASGSYEWRAFTYE